MPGKQCAIEFEAKLDAICPEGTYRVLCPECKRGVRIGFAWQNCAPTTLYVHGVSFPVTVDENREMHVLDKCDRCKKLFRYTFKLQSIVEVEYNARED